MLKKRDNDYKLLAWRLLIELFLTGIITIELLVLFGQQIGVVDFFTIIGTLLSVGGIYLGILQIQSAQQTKDEAIRAVKSDRRTQSIFELSRGQKELQRIYPLISTGQYEWALEKMKTVNEIIVALETNDDLQNIKISSNFDAIYTDFVTLMKQFESFTNKTSVITDFQVLYDNMSAMWDLFLKFINVLKNNDNDTTRI